MTTVFWPGRGHTQPLRGIQAGTGSEDLIIDGEGEREGEERLTSTPNLTPKAAVNIFSGQSQFFFLSLGKGGGTEDGPCGDS